MRKKLKKPRVQVVSLVREPRTGLGVVQKGESDEIEVGTLTQTSDDGGTLTCVVYAPNRDDADGEFADAETVREMAYTHAREGLKLDVRHDGVILSKGEAFVAESFIIQKGDARFADWKDVDGNPVGDCSGGWAQIIRLESPAIREKFRKGELRGVSLLGTAEREAVKGDSALSEFLREIKNAFMPKAEKERDMTPAEVQTLIDSAIKKDREAVQKAADDAAAAAKKAADDAAKKAADDEPIFKGDISKVEDLEAFQKELRAHNLKKRLADPKTRDAALAEAMALAKGETPPASGSAPAPSNLPANMKKGEENDPECQSFWSPTKPAADAK